MTRRRGWETRSSSRLASLLKKDMWAHVCKHMENSFLPFDGSGKIPWLLLLMTDGLGGCWLLCPEWGFPWSMLSLCSFKAYHRGVLSSWEGLDSSINTYVVIQSTSMNEGPVMWGEWSWSDSHACPSGVSQNNSETLYSIINCFKKNNMLGANLLSNFHIFDLGDKTIFVYLLLLLLLKSLLHHSLYMKCSTNKIHVSVLRSLQTKS